MKFCKNSVTRALFQLKLAAFLYFVYLYIFVCFLPILFFAVSNLFSIFLVLSSPATSFFDVSEPSLLSLSSTPVALVVSGVGFTVESPVQNAALFSAAIGTEHGASAEGVSSGSSEGMHSAVRALTKSSASVEPQVLSRTFVTSVKSSNKSVLLS